MNKIEVTERKTLDELYAGSAFTMEGFAPEDENLEMLLDWIKGLTEVKDETFYIVSGATMNRAYGLTGTNAYPDENSHLVCMKLDAMVSPDKITMPRFAIGGRWFDDVVDNNARREAEKSGAEC